MRTARLRFGKQVSRGRVLAEPSSHPRCAVAMEACASAQERGREVSALGHEVRLVPPAHAKLFVKRRKGDAADDAFRSHLAEFGIVVPRGPAHAGRLAVAAGSEAPEAVRGTCGALLRMIDTDGEEMAEIEKEMRARAAAETARLMSIPGTGPAAAKKGFHRVPAAVARRGGQSPDGVGGAGKPKERVRANGYQDGIGKTGFRHRVFERTGTVWARSASLRTGPRRATRRNRRPDA